MRNRPAGRSARITSQVKGGSVRDLPVTREFVGFSWRLVHLPGKCQGSAAAGWTGCAKKLREVFHVELITALLSAAGSSAGAMPCPPRCFRAMKKEPITRNAARACPRSVSTVGKTANHIPIQPEV